jgi:hypothetical protein
MFSYVVLREYLINHVFDLLSGKVATEVTVMFMADFMHKVVDDVSKNLVC